MPRKKQHQNNAPEIAYYNIEITGWDWEYSFSVNLQKNEDRCFADYFANERIGIIQHSLNIADGAQTRMSVWVRPGRDAA